MSAQRSGRRSTRAKQSMSYQESPNTSQPKLRSAKKVEQKLSPSVSPKKLRNNRTPSSKALESIVTENSPSVEKIDSPGSRRRSVRKSASKYKSKEEPKIDYFEESIETIDVSDDSFRSDKENVRTNKPTTLFDDSEDVEGSKLYGFRTPKRREGMTQLANQTPKTPRLDYDASAATPRTPKHLRLSEIQKTPTSRPSAGKCTKTPRHVRDEIKKKLTKVKFQEINSDDDFSSDNDSEFNPEKSSSESSDSSDSDEDHPVLSSKKSQTVAARVLKTPSVQQSVATGLRRSSRIKNDVQCILQSDSYFTSQSSKSKTSDHTLDRLKNPRLPHDQLMKFLSEMKVSKEHENCIREMNEEYKMLFRKWMIYFNEGYTVMLHGLGSKRNLMQAFLTECLSKRCVVVVNGFFPSLTIKDILDAILDNLEMSTAIGTPHEAVNIIEEEMKKTPEFHIFMIIHNIDGIMLRNDRAQSILSRLAAIKNLHIIASIDHINTPLLWNNCKLSNYNFQWFDVTSYLPYTDETAFENSFLVTSSGNLELSSLRSVFLSLTSNARGIYLLLVKYQLANGNSPNYQGISFKDLYTGCREGFLVSSDIALRAQLTEFLDHKLAKMKRNIDGAENITIPIKNSLLEKFLSEQN